MDGFGKPGWWTAQPRQLALSGRWTWAVNLNNHTDVLFDLPERAAKIEAARRNYENGSYSRLPKIGLDGLEEWK